MNVVRPQPGEGWPRLLMTPTYNGGDEYPPEITAEQMDAALPLVECVGLTVDGTPAAMFTVQPAARADGQAEALVHWASDGRAPLSASLDLLDAITHQRPGTRFLAFVRRPALVRLLASRGWWLHAHEDEPFMALMACQRAMSDSTK